MLYEGIKRRRKDLLSKVTNYQRSENRKLIYIDKSYNFLKICNQIRGFQIKIELTGYKFLNIVMC